MDKNQALRLQVEGASGGLTGGRVPFFDECLFFLAQSSHFVNQDISALQE